MSFLGDYGVSGSGGGGGGGGSGGLTTAYEVDFTSLATQPIAGDGAVIIDGHNWVFANFANATSAGVVNGTGLQITCNGSISGWGVGTYTAPVLYAPLTDFLIELSEVLRVRLSMRFSAVNQDTNFESIYLAISTPPVAATVNHVTWRMQKVWNGGLQFQNFIQANAIGGGLGSDTTNITDDVMGLSVSGIDMCEFNTGVYAAGFPSNYRRRFLRSLTANSSIDAPNNNSDFCAVLGCGTNGGGGGTNLQFVCQNMKLEYWE